MTNLDILIPFALPPAEMAKDLLRELKTPGLAMLLARSKSAERLELDAYSHALPHEAWLAGRFGLADQAKSGSFPFARPMMQSLGVSADSGHWFIIQPVHFHVARDHIVLTDPRKLTIADQESRRFFESIRPYFEESGRPLVYGNARTWFMRADEWADLQTSSPEAASGHNIDIWMPKGGSARAWRKLLNEVQMLWHSHALNEERESKGLQPVNSLWLWGGGKAGISDVKLPYRQVFNAPAWMPDMDSSLASIEPAAGLAGLLDGSASSSLVVLSNLMNPALASDWSAWLENMRILEKHWFSVLPDALKDGKIGQLGLVLTHGTQLFETVSGKNSLRKFWIKPSLSSLSG